MTNSAGTSKQEGSLSSQAGTNGADELVPKTERLGLEQDDDESGSDGEGADEVAGEEEGGAGGEDGGKKKKKKKKKKSKSKGKAAESAADQTQLDLINVVRDNMTSAEGQSVSDNDIRKALKAVDFMKLFEDMGAANSKGLTEHKFWKTQPVPQQEGSEFLEGPIDPPKTVEEIKKDPIALPAGFEWSVIDVKNEEQMLEAHTLLTENYVEDDEAMFRFRYSKEFLLWALTAPGYDPDWHIGVRVQKTGKLVAFISGIKVELRCRQNTFDSAEINFLCVHKKLRTKRLAPVLIKEVTRRINLTNIWQAIYTAGIVIPTPFSTCRYYHRNLNPPKLVDIGFSPVPRGSTVARLVRQYAVGTETLTPGFREMTAADVPQVAALLRRFMNRYDIVQTFNTDDDVAHWFTSGRGREENGKRVEQVVWSYVVEDPTTHLITDLVSFYSLPSTIMKHPKHNVLNAAYMYYYASDVVFSPSGSSNDAAAYDAKAKSKLDERLNALVGDLLIVARNHGFDVLNALSLMDNNVFLQPQLVGGRSDTANPQFGPGDGTLNYYLYNWSTAPIDGGMKGTVTREGSKLGVVML